MATWTTPRTNWTESNYVRLSNVYQLAGSLIYLHDLIIEKGGDVPTISDLAVISNFGYTDFLTAPQFTNMERALYLYSEEMNRNFGVAKVFPAYNTYSENGFTPDYERFNEIGTAMIAIYNALSDNRHVLPLELQEVAYIEQNGSAYIDTGVAPNDNTQMDLRFYTTCTSNFYCAGAMDDYGKVIFAQDGAASGSLVSATVNSNRSIATTQGARWARTSSGQTYDISLLTQDDSYSYSIHNVGEGIDFISSKSYGSIDGATASICVFALNSRSVISGTNRLYRMKIKKDGLLVRNFAPCRNTTTGEVGLFDLVQNKFYGSANSRTFTAGANVY